MAVTTINKNSQAILSADFNYFSSLRTFLIGDVKYFDESFHNFEIMIIIFFVTGNMHLENIDKLQLVHK